MEYILNMDTSTIIIIWAVVIAVALLLEFITYEFYTSWFSIGGTVALIMAAFGVDLAWQVVAFVLVSILFMFLFRPMVKRKLDFKTIPTNTSANVGKVVRLLEDVVDGRSSIKLFGVTWTVNCDEGLKTGDEVEITGTDGNKYVVKGANNTQ